MSDHDVLEDFRKQLTEAARKIELQDGVLNMAVDRLGGIVEGRPTGRHNFLQRIDQLIAQEGRYRYWLWANHGHPAQALYGDDGEMQCKYCPIVDYKRAEIGELEDQATIARGVNLAQRWAIEADKEAELAECRKQLDALQKPAPESHNESQQ